MAWMKRVGWTLAGVALLAAVSVGVYRQRVLPVTAGIGRGEFQIADQVARRRAVREIDGERVALHRKAEVSRAARTHPFQNRKR